MRDPLSILGVLNFFSKKTELVLWQDECFLTAASLYYQKRNNNQKIIHN